SGWRVLASLRARSIGCPRSWRRGFGAFAGGDQRAVAAIDAVAAQRPRALAHRLGVAVASGGAARGDGGERRPDAAALAVLVREAVARGQEQGLVDRRGEPGVALDRIAGGGVRSLAERLVVEEPDGEAERAQLLHAQGVDPARSDSIGERH